MANVNVMATSYRMENTRGDVRRERSESFSRSGAVYYGRSNPREFVPTFHFVPDSQAAHIRIPDDWFYEGRVANAAERFVIESHGEPVTVIEETPDGDRFIGVFD
jgi:hypothetical protein